jgi:WD40 repeat protein
MKWPRQLLLLGLLLTAQRAPSTQPPETTAARPRLVVQLGHAAAVHAVAWSPDGRFVLTGSADHTACLWDAATGIEIQRYRGHTKAVHSVAFAPDGQTIITGSHDQTIRFWHRATAQEQRQIKAVVYSSDHVNVVAVAPDGNQVLAAGTNLLIWNLATGAPPLSLEGYVNNINYAAFSPDSRFVLTGSVDQTARLWEVATGKQLHTYRTQVFKKHPMTGHELLVPPVAFARDGRVLTGGDIAILWDSAMKQELRRFATNGGQVDTVAISPDGRFVLTGESPLDFPLVKKLRWWDATTGAELHATEWPIATGGDDIALAFAPDGRAVLAACGSSIRAFEAASGQLIQRFESYAGGVNALALAQAGRWLLTGSDAGHAHLWDLEAGQQQQRFVPASSGLAEFVRGLDGLRSVAVSADGRTALTGRSDGTVSVWDVATGKPKQTLKAFRGSVVVALSPEAEGRLALIGGNEEALLWETSTGKILHRFRQGFGVTIWSVAFSPDGRAVLLGSSGLTRAALACQWEVASGQQINCLNLRNTALPAQLGASVPGLPSPEDARDAMLNNGVPRVAYSPDGQFIAVAKGPSFANLRPGDVRVFEAATGKLLQQFVPPGDSRAIAFSPDGNFLLLGCDNGWLYLWDRRAEKPVHSFQAHASTVQAVAFAATGQQLISASEDGTTRFWNWNAQTYTELCQLVSFHDGRWVVVEAEGRFDTNSLEENRGLRWVMPDDPLTPLPLEIYLRDYYQPQLLDLRLRGASLKPVRRLSRLNRAQPDVKIISVAAQANQPEFVTVTVAVTANAGGVFDLRLFRDGQLVAQQPPPETGTHTTRRRRSEAETLSQWRAQTRVATTPTSTITFPKIRLPRGATVVEFAAYAFNEDRVKSVTHRWSHNIAPPLPPAAKRAFLITMGVNQSQNEAWSLLIAGHDAAQMQRRLREQLARTNEYQVIPLQLTAQQATKRNLQLLLQRLAGPTDAPLPPALQALAQTAPATPDDLLILSISSHGVRDRQGHFYLLPYDIGAGRSTTVREALLNRCISSDELTDWLRAIDAGAMALIIDACYSAAAIKTAEFKPGPMGDAGLGQLAYDKGMQILAASQSDQIALDSRATALSYLTQALIPEGIGKRLADQFPADGKITLSEWLRYGVQRVPELHAQEFPPQQWQFAGTDNKRPPSQRNAPVLQRPALFDFARSPRRDVILVQAQP